MIGSSFNCPPRAIGVPSLASKVNYRSSSLHYLRPSRPLLHSPVEPLRSFRFVQSITLRLLKSAHPYGPSRQLVPPGLRPFDSPHSFFRLPASTPIPPRASGTTWAALHEQPNLRTCLTNDEEPKSWIVGRRLSHDLASSNHGETLSRCYR